MSVTTQVKLLESDSNSLYKTQEIKFTSNKSIFTPTKTIPLDKLNVVYPLNDNANQLNEIFKRFSAKQIKEDDEYSSKYGKIESFFNRQRNKIKPGTLTFCFLDFNEPRIPTNDEIEFLTHIAYCNSDITTIPTISQFNNSENPSISYENYKKYLENAIESIEQLNRRPIMGIIPKMAPKKIPDLLGFYQDKGINSFAIDLDGSNPISANMRIFKVLKSLNKMKILDSCYIHGHNVGMRVNKVTDIIPAKDILGFGIGLNSLGEKRKEFKPNHAFILFIKTNPLNKFRLFNKKEYSYWKAISWDDLEKIYPLDSGIPVVTFKNAIKNADQFNNIQKAFNSEQLAIESHRIKEVITEDADKTINYINKKKDVDPNDIIVIESGPEKIK
ncbi:hypothetical protein MSIBF_A1770010 [groundwater metagenome]|uniref:Uncharacterized protein n=1 Tax=groundwater metagenome TaxID=717931 RepID=A0A098E8T8_9ZZZZ